MNFMIQLLDSLDELLFRVMSWLVFYPLTLWRTMLHPLRMTTFADQQMTEAEERRHVATVSPPLFLFLSLLVSHGLELALVGDSPLLSEHHRLGGLVNDDTSLLVMRLAFFAVFPLLVSIRLLQRRRAALTRDTLKPPFYSQCYLAAPFALTVGMAATLMQTHAPWAELTGAAMVLIALVWFIAVETAWFRQELGAPIWRCLLDAVIVTVQGVAILAIAAPLFG
ncbi:hypothetical protein ABOZ73_16725 [Caulobacter sp. 73W]|uniref:Permease n=1 Tax=Caulobacter sp. 73W TaxID=3161137 RepID=A0AB39KS04_9CAUL